MPGRQSGLTGVQLWIKLQAETNLTIELKMKEHSVLYQFQESKVCIYNRMVAHFVTSLVEVLSINQCREGECESLKQFFLAKVPFKVIF